MSTAIKPRLVRGWNVNGVPRWFCGENIAQVNFAGEFAVWIRRNTPYGAGLTPFEAWHNWKRATVPHYRTRLEQQAQERR